MIFSHVLYQLSYPAGRLAGSDSTVLARSYQASGRLPGTAGSVRPARLSGFGEAVQLEGGLDHLLGERADDGLGLLARLEERYGRDAGDPEVAGERRLGVHIDLRDLHRTFVLGGDLGHDRGDLPARPAPRRPEVYQDRDLGVQDFFFESVDRNRYGLGHAAPPDSFICSLVYFVVKARRSVIWSVVGRPVAERRVSGRGGSDGTRTRGLRRDRPAF